jgi:hypothetical protein
LIAGRPRLRALPIRLDPLPGEPLDSWLEAYACRLHTPLRDLLAAVGLWREADLSKPSPSLGTLTVLLHEEEAAAASHATGLRTPLLHALTLRVFDEHALVIDRASRSVRSDVLWARPRGSRYCPQCLKERGGRWLLRWRLTWVFACTQHGRILLSRCPQCGGEPRRVALGHSYVPQPGVCQAGGLKGVRCGCNLANAPTEALEPNHPLLQAQAWIDALLSRVEDGNVKTRPCPRAIFEDLWIIACRIVSMARPEEFSYWGPRAVDEASAGQESRRIAQRSLRYRGYSAVITGAALGRAICIISANIPRRSPIQLSEIRGVEVPTVEWLNAAKRSRELIWRAVGLRPASTAPYFHPRGTLAFRVRRTPTRAAEMRSRYIPEMLWPGWSVRLLPPNDLNVGSRKVLSLGIRMLGHIDASWNSFVSHKDRHLSGDSFSCLLIPEFDSVLAVLSNLARYLDRHGSPIDYARRRNLDMTDLLPDRAWYIICEALDAHPGGARRVRDIRRYLYARITGSPFSDGPYPIQKFNFERVDLAISRIAFKGNLVRALDCYAADYLREHGIHEPVAWEPPPQCGRGLALPGRDPGELIRQFKQLVTRDLQSPRQAALRLGTTVNHVALATESQPVRCLCNWSRRWTVAARKIAEAEAILTARFLDEQLRQAGKSVRRLARERRLRPWFVQRLAIKAWVIDSPPSAHLGEYFGTIALPLAGPTAYLRVEYGGPPTYRRYS